MNWLQLRLDCGKANADAVEQALLASGALSVTLQDRADEPLLEPAVGTTPLWKAIRITGLYLADTDMDEVLASLADLDDSAAPKVEILEDKDWEREWMQHYEPMRFGERVWICPSWKEPPEPDAINLLLDPGLAFGTGTHPTTAMCLTAIDAMHLEGARVVDFGCGSGILGIAALRLGAVQLLAVDNDPQALTATADNAGRNRIAPQRLDIVLPENLKSRDWQGRADLVLANILAGPLADLSEELCSFLAPGGQLVLAGLLDTQADALIAHYAPRIELSILQQQAEWVCLAGKLP